MTEPIWLLPEAVLAIHEEQIAEHGGLAGIRDEGLLVSALARPQNKAGCGETDLAVFAAAYAYWIARNHPFFDGNKRTAYVAMEVFLQLNGMRLVAGDVDATMAFLRMSAGELDEDALMHWIRSNLVPSAGSTS